MRWHVQCLNDNCKGPVPFQDKLRTLKRPVVPEPPPAAQSQRFSSQDLATTDSYLPARKHGPERTIQHGTAG